MPSSSSSAMPKWLNSNSYFTVPWDWRQVLSIAQTLIRTKRFSLRFHFFVFLKYVNKANKFCCMTSQKISLYVISRDKFKGGPNISTACTSCFSVNCDPSDNKGFLAIYRCRFHTLLSYRSKLIWDTVSISRKKTKKIYIHVYII